MTRHPAHGPRSIGYEVWFLTGSQHLYGPETLRPGRRPVAADRPHPRRGGSRGLPVKIVWKPVLTDCRLAIKPHSRSRSNARDDRVIGLIAWMHTFSPAKMWIAGLDALQKPLAAPAHAGERRAALGGHRLRLHEPESGRARRPRVRLHPDAPRRAAQDRRRSRERTPSWCVRRSTTWQRAAAGLGGRPARSSSPASATTCAYVAVTEGDKTEAELQLRRAGQHLGRERSGRMPSMPRHPTAEIDALVAGVPRGAVRGRADELKPRCVTRHQSLRDGAAIEIGLRTFLEEGGFGAFTTSFEDLGALTQLPGLAVQRLMAEGYGFGAEGDWKTAILVRVANVMGAGLPGGASPHGGLHLRHRPPATS